MYLKYLKIKRFHLQYFKTSVYYAVLKVSREERKKYGE